MKTVQILTSLILALCVASPAMATLKISDNFSVAGYLRTQFDLQTLKDQSVNPKSESVIDQRFRLKSTYTVNDNLYLVYYAEVDTQWGLKSKGNVGGGGQAGTDGVNIESKNVYADLKIPDSNAKVRVGLQGIADEVFEGMVIDEDMAGLSFSTDLGGMKLMVNYAKLNETEKTQWDDTDFYGLIGETKLSDMANLGLGAYFLDVNTTDPTAFLQDASIFWYGARTDLKLGKAGLAGMLIVQSGEIDSQDTTAFMASVKGNFSLADAAKATLRLTYFSSDDDADNDGAWYGGHDDLGLGMTDMTSEGLMIMLKDKWICNNGTTAYAIEDGARGGYGMIGLTGTASFSKLPNDLYLNLAAGAFMAADDTKDGDASTKRQGNMIGYEVAGQIGKKFADKFDLSLRGAYAVFGDFYDDTVTNENGNPDSPDNVYKVSMMINVPF